MCKVWEAALAIAMLALPVGGDVSERSCEITPSRVVQVLPVTSAILGGPEAEHPPDLHLGQPRHECGVRLLLVVLAALSCSGRCLVGDDGGAGASDGRLNSGESSRILFRAISA